MITKDKLIAIVPSAKNAKIDLDLFASIVNAEFPDNVNRQAMFIAQCAHESAGFSRLVENLNYSSERLLVVFKKYFANAGQANFYHRNPEKIANKVYANRIGNGPEDSGDGWKFRGRGLVQVTGRENYKKCGEYLGVDLVKNPEYLETTEGAIKSALWFWNSRDLSKFADADDITGATKVLNGGTNGLEERKHYYDVAKKVLIT